MPSQPLIACHECDLLQREVELPPGGKAICPRCGATLYTHRADTIDRTLALMLAAAILFVVGDSFPVVSMEFRGPRTNAMVWDALGSRARKGIRGSLAAVERVVAADAPLQQDLRDTVREVSRAAASLGVLTDYLERHPEALIRGKPEEKPRCVS